MSEDEFVQKARQDVEAYLNHFRVPYSRIAGSPDWHVDPYVAIWAVFGRSASTPGWFAISGDVPTDYVSSDDAPDARSAMRHFARVWGECARAMLDGRPHPHFRIGQPKDWPELQPLLEERALSLHDLAENDSLWN